MRRSFEANAWSTAQLSLMSFAAASTQDNMVIINNIWFIINETYMYAYIYICMYMPGKFHCWSL